MHQPARMSPIHRIGCQNQPKNSAMKTSTAMKGKPSGRIGTSIPLIERMIDSAACIDVPGCGEGA